MAKQSKLEALFEKAKELEPITAAIICPESSVALEGAILAAEQKSIIPILIGDVAKIKKVAQEINKDISNYQIIDVQDFTNVDVIKHAIAGAAQLIVKGSLHSDEFMRMILRRDSGLRTEHRMSHCQVMDIPAYKKLLILTDVALNMFPNIEEKKDIIQHAINLAIALGVAKPKVAILSALETINPRIPTTTESVELCKIAAMGGITGGIVEGPLSFDLAVSEDSVKIKRLATQVGGDADILVVPNIEAGNILMKALDYFADASGLGIVLGAKLPIVLTSRAATASVRAKSCMLAKFIHAQKSSM